MTKENCRSLIEQCVQDKIDKKTLLNALWEFYDLLDRHIELKPPGTHFRSDTMPAPYLIDHAQSPISGDSISIDKSPRCLSSIEWTADDILNSQLNKT